MEYKNRLSELRGKTSQKEFAERIGLTQQNYWNYENGKQGLRSDLIERICKEFNVSSEWLLGFDADRRPLPDGAIRPVRSEPAVLPLVGRVHAGNMTEPENVEDMIELPAKVADSHPNAFFLQVEGDCMDKIYTEFCYVLVDPDREPQDGSIGVVSIDMKTVMRRVKRGANTLILSPESNNHEHRDIVIEADDQIVENVGTVVWFQSKEEME